MDNQTTNKLQNEINKYLVTEAIDPNAIPKKKVDTDLNLLHDSEVRANYQMDISHGVDNPELSRAMQALKLANPFKGY